MTAASLEHAYSLPHGYSVRFSREPGQPFVSRWSPDVPLIRKASQRRKFLKAYWAARREFLTELAATIGGNVLVVDTDPCMTCETILAPTKH